MDDFVRDKLTEWGCESYISTFEEHCVNEESFRCFEEKDFEKLIPERGKFVLVRKHLRKFKEEQQRDEGHSNEPSTSATPTAGATPTARATPRRDQRKRKRSMPGSKNPPKRASTSQTHQDDKLDIVKKAMDSVLKKLRTGTDDNGIVQYLRKSIEELNVNKKELIGVFGRIGAGKSSLINAFIEDEDLLPTGSIEACTSVIIKVEANTGNQYMTEVELISQEDFNNEMELLRPYFGEDAEEERDMCDPDYKSKLRALFGNEWTKKSLDSMKTDKRYEKIVTVLKKKTLKESYPASKKQKLCKDLKIYTKDESVKDCKTTWFWPVVKSVTIKVPNCELLHDVTLVDLPGNGDCNKTRNEMWKKMVNSCRTVWVVTEGTRPANDGEAWEILDSACKNLGHGGECSNILFICNKLDNEIRKKTNTVDEFKEEVKKTVDLKIKDHAEFKKHFSNDCFKVFTVSAEEHFKKELLTPDQNEIKKLQDFIRERHSQQERASRYVSAAYGILALMKGASGRKFQDQDIEQLRQILSKKVKDGLGDIEKIINDGYSDFDQSLTRGVQNAQNQCERKIKSIITDNKKNQSYHRTLKSIVEKNGVHKPRKKSEINLNTALSSFLTDCINDKFRTIFPNDSKPGSVWETIDDFSFNTKELHKDYKQFELALKFLEQEEKKFKRNLSEEIRERKKSIYNCLTETVQREMQPCYDEAKQCTSGGSLQKMRETIMRNIEEKKSTMFVQAKDELLGKLKELENFVKSDFKKEQLKVINLSLSHDEELPDISGEFSTVMKSHLDLAMDL